MVVEHPGVVFGPGRIKNEVVNISDETDASTLETKHKGHESYRHPGTMKEHAIKALMPREVAYMPACRNVTIRLEGLSQVFASIEKRRIFPESFAVAIAGDKGELEFARGCFQERFVCGLRDEAWLYLWAGLKNVCDLSFYML
jgi:hypothetical protein